MSSSSLSLVRTKTQMFIFWFGAVPFHICNSYNNARIWQQTHMCVKIVQTLDTKVCGRLKRQIGKMGWGEPVKINIRDIQRDIHWSADRSNSFSLVLMLNVYRPICICIFMCVFQHAFYDLLSDSRVKMRHGSTWSKEETECLLDIGRKYLCSMLSYN